MKYLLETVTLCLVTIFFVTCSPNNSKSVLNVMFDGNGDDLKHIRQEMVAPPFLPKHEQVNTGEPVVIDIRLVIEEKKMEIAPGDSIWALTFNGSVPGPMIVAHQNDFVEITLVNPATNTMQHNIDLHAATGEMGGGDLTLVNPGEEAVFRFRASRTGVFVYHCAPGGMMVPMHVASGMNGAIMILPRDGLKDETGNLVKYDRAYFIAEQDYYLPKDKDGKYKNFATPSAGLQEMPEVMRTLVPSHLVFNGAKGSLIGKKALTANVGENVLFITSQANRDTRIHLIGGHADLVWPGGKFNNTPNTDFETWAIPAGSAVAALYKFREPGTYVYLNHNLIEAFAFGAFAQIKVEGKWEEDLMKQIRKPGKIK